MKRCPTCNRTFTDQNLSFCIEDGTPLVKADASAYDPDATVVASSPSRGSEGTVPPEGASSDWEAPAYQPPPRFPPPPASQKKKLWPWVLGALSLLVLFFVGLGIAAAVFVPQMMKEARNRNTNRSSFPSNTASNTNQNTNTNTNTNDNSNSPLNDNSSSLPLNDNSTTLPLNDNSNSNEIDSDPPPTSEEAVLADLKSIEDEWTVANLTADKKKLARILADDYVGTNVDGSIQGKADYLRDIKPDPTIQRWEFKNLKLTLAGSRATLTGLVSLESSRAPEPLVLRFTDKFVWREGRWQAVSSEVVPLRSSNQ
jgi:hypothetical protein